MFDIVLCLRNKYLNLNPSESLSTAVGRDGKSYVLVGVPRCPEHQPSLRESCHAQSLHRGGPPSAGAGGQERGGALPLC